MEDLTKFMHEFNANIKVKIDGVYFQWIKDDIRGFIPDVGVLVAPYFHDWAKNEN